MAQICSILCVIPRPICCKTISNISAVYGIAYVGLLQVVKNESDLRVDIGLTNDFFQA